MVENKIEEDEKMLKGIISGYKAHIGEYVGEQDVYGNEIITKEAVEDHLKEIIKVIVEVIQGLKISDAIVTEILNSPISEKIGKIEIRKQIKEKAKLEGLYREFDGVEYILSVNELTDEVVGVETLEEYYEEYYKDRVKRMSEISRVGYKVRKISYELRDKVEEVKNKRVF